MTLRPLMFTSGLVGVALIGWLSLVPGAMRPHALSSGYAEHFIAYALVSLCLCAGAGTRIRSVWAILLLSVMSAVLEIAQIGIPGRSAEALGTLASTAGAIAGGAASIPAERLLGLLQK
ncbi:MAG: hypothetical protein Q7T73_12635 [Beijerinckiaceae bacterium]|nr:hypothetical protein [Beijerinckiaceae bacterium]